MPSQQQVFVVQVKLLSGRNLVAKDRGFFGLARTAKTSDPYVVLSTQKHKHRDDGKYSISTKTWGKTAVIPKDLNPTWNAEFDTLMVAVKDVSRVNLVFAIYDADKLGKDDPMGVVTMPFPTETTARDGQATWHPVRPGTAQDPDQCPNATGELQIQVLSVQQKTYIPPQPDVVPGGPGRLASSQTYLLAEKLFSFSGNTYKIRDANSGHAAFIIQGKAMSLRDRMEFKDATTGRTICILDQKVFSMVTSYAIWTLAPNYLGQKPEMMDYDGTTPLYKYAQMEREYMTINPTLHCLVYRGNDGRLHSSATCKEDAFSIGMNAVIQGTPHGIGVLATCDQTSLFQYSNGNEFAVQVRAGACPILCLCLSVAMDHMLEESRRRRK